MDPYAPRLDSNLLNLLAESSSNDYGALPPCFPTFAHPLRKYYKYHMQRLQTTANHVLFYVRACV